MNSENSKIFDPHTLLVNLLDKLNFYQIFYAWKNITKFTKNNKLKVSPNVKSKIDHILCQIFKIILRIS